MGPFAGWEMPIEYSSIGDEHRAVRADAGVFDVSHMGQLAARGRRQVEQLQSRLSNDLDLLAPGQAQYTLLLNEQGGIEEDLIALCLAPDELLLVVNAANVERDHALLPELEDVSDSWALLAVQGPRALERLGLELEPSTVKQQAVLGVGCLVCGTGYTGERGCELGCSPEDAPLLWERILGRGVVPCGLGARDTLRLEACLPLHGNDIGPQRTPLEAGLERACAFEKEFVGAPALRRQLEQGTRERLVPFVMEERAIPRSGMSVLEGGSVTSGTYSPLLERGVGLAYVDVALAEPGAKLTVDVRGRPRRARVARRPLHRTECIP